MLSFQIINATMKLKKKGKPDFFPQSQMHLDITNQTANLKYILEKIKVEWGEDYVIVTNNGIELEDSPATQGTDCTAFSSRLLIESSLILGEPWVKPVVQISSERKKMCLKRGT